LKKGHRSLSLKALSPIVATHARGMLPSFKDTRGACMLMDRTKGIAGRLARILHEAFYYERRKHRISGLILAVRTRMYFSTIRPQTSRINFALQARTFRTSTALATKFRTICGLEGSLALSCLDLEGPRGNMPYSSPCRASGLWCQCPGMRSCLSAGGSPPTLWGLCSMAEEPISNHRYGLGKAMPAGFQRELWDTRTKNE